MRTVLLLINGFGIETKDSYSVYDEKTMPNFDKLAKQYMFSSLESTAANTIDGFRSMSLEMNELYNYSIYTRDMAKVIASPTVAAINKTLVERKSKLHLFCFVDTSLSIVDNLKHFLTLINKEQDKKIFLHIILTSNNYEDYPKILDVLSKINIELGELASIGMIMGLSNILNSNPQIEMNFLIRTMISEVGERWSSFKQKLDFSYGTKSAPISVKPFVVNSGFGIGENDLMMVWNYDNLDISNFINSIRSINYGDKPNTITFFSLFPITYKESIPYILNFEVAKKSLATNMKGLGFKSLVLCNRNEINGINYYLNGMQMVSNPDISYICLEDKIYDIPTVLSVVNTYKQDLLVINFDITKFSSVEELKQLLTKIDSVIGAIYDNTNKEDYCIIISSLHGMNKTVNSISGEICNIRYVKVPIVYIDKFITKKDYLVNSGDISKLFKTCYKSINKKYPGESLVTKKNLLYRMVFK